MIRLVLVGLLFMAVYWLGRRVGRHERASRRIARRRGAPPCPSCQARLGFQRIQVGDDDTYVLCRACLREVDRTPHRA